MPEVGNAHDFKIPNAGEQAATEPRDFARLLWMLEYLIYDDLLRGTGWGRKRGWFRDTLDKCKSLSQVSDGFRP